MAGLWTPGAITPAVTPAGSTADSEENEKILSPDFLSTDQIADLLEEMDMDEVQEKMRVILNFKNLQTCLRDAILLDYYVSGFFWAKDMNFSVYQHSKFMTLLDMLLHNLQTLHMSLEDSIKWLGEVMAEIGPNHSQKNEQLHIFDVKDANAIIDYLKISLFQHYRLYEFMFYSTREEIVIGTSSSPSPSPALLSLKRTWDGHSHCQKKHIASPEDIRSSPQRCSQAFVTSAPEDMWLPNMKVTKYRKYKGLQTVFTDGVVTFK
ncbi:Cabcoco1 [Phodopus roborovskii]|uniref:Cabcoco1 protein n=1 Tax=Phodopus roborovskii TaxID=109678 RepID=A0AAU9ZCK6_PHORO|nr:Cabcoco1 [Phodopus roborovskii]